MNCLVFETFYFKIYEDPALVREVTRPVGEFHLAPTCSLCDFSCVFAVYAADESAHKAGAMFSPQTVKEHFLPWHRKMS